VFPWKVCDDLSSGAEFHQDRPLFAGWFHYDRVGRLVSFHSFPFLFFFPIRIGGGRFAAVPTVDTQAIEKRCDENKKQFNG
jgi:hypothetical protein